MKIETQILFLLPRLSGGGAERVFLNLLIGLYNRGYLVEIIVFDKNGPLLSMLPSDIPIHDLEKKSLKYSIFSLVKKIQRLKPKIIFSTLGYINVTILSISWLLPKDTKIWIREANLPSISIPNNNYPELITILYKIFYGKSDRLICTSERMKNEFISDLSIPEKKIYILHNPVDVNLVRSSAFPVKRFDKGGVCYVASGRLVYQKGFDRLLYWFSKIKNQKSTLVILGEGILKNELVQKTKLLDLQAQVKFIGFCNNPWQWYAGADVFLLSSRWEGMPNSVLESLACGVPVIATVESGGILEITENRKDVRIAHNEIEFIDLMNKVEKKSEQFERKSLLPDKYKKDNVILSLERWCNPPKK